MTISFTKTLIRTCKSLYAVPMIALLSIFILQANAQNAQPCTGFHTQTQGAWGADAKGGNPGTYRDANFAGAFPNGLTIGCNGGNKLVLTSAAAVNAFLPSGTTASVLPAGTLTNPGSSYSNILAGQLVTAVLNVGFDAYDPNFSSNLIHTGDLVITTGIFMGKKVSELIAEANAVIGGCASTHTPDELNAALTSFNENYDNGTVDNGFVTCCNISVTGKKTDITCYGAANGAIDITVSNYHGSVSYLWNDDNTNEDRTGLSAGDYSVEVTDAIGCKDTSDVFTINEPLAIDISSTQINVTVAGGNDGSIDITVTGGTGAYSYLWNDGVTTEDRTGLSAGTYTVTVHDANGCSSNKVIVITQPSNCTGFHTQTQGGWGAAAHGGNPGTYRDANFAGAFPNGLTIGCNGGNKLVLTSSAAVQGFLPSGSTPSVLPAGTLTDPTRDSYSNVFAGQLVAATLNVGFDAYDPNFSSNSIHTGDLTITTGTFAGKTVNELIAEANQVIGGCATTHTPQELSDALTSFNENYDNGTVDNGYTSCTPLCNIVLTGKLKPVSCWGGNDGAIDLTVNGGTSPYTYLWNDGATTEDRTGLKAGRYSVTVTDSKGCSVTSRTAPVSQPDRLKIQDTVKAQSAPHICDGKARLSATGGTAPYKFVWEDGYVGAYRTGLCMGIYHITVTDKRGCSCVHKIRIPCGDYVAQQSSPTSEASALSTKLNIATLSVSPNPARDLVKVVMNTQKAGDAVLSVIDFTGKVVFHSKITLVQGSNQQQLNLGSFAKGLYQVQLVSDEGTSVVKVVLN